MNEASATIIYASVVSREMVRIALMIIKAAHLMTNYDGGSGNLRKQKIHLRLIIIQR